MSRVIQRLSRNLSSLFNTKGSVSELSEMKGSLTTPSFSPEVMIPPREISTGDSTRFANIPLNDKESIRSFVNQIDTFIFDCDGVIYEGGRLIQNSTNLLHMLRKMNKKIFFLTNTSCITRQEFLQRLTKKGIECEINELYCATYLTAKYFQLILPNVNAVYLIGTDSFKSELESVGLTVYGGEEENDKLMDTEIFRNMSVDPDVEAVVIGEDERFNYYKLNMASIYLKNKNSFIFSANIDNYDNINKRNYSGAGALLAAIEATSNKKIKYTAGKPNPFMFQLISKIYPEIIRDRTCMIGDRLDTDIYFAKNCGIISLLTLSGVTRPNYFQEEIYTQKNVRPNFVISHVGKIFEMYN